MYSNLLVFILDVWIIHDIHNLAYSLTHEYIYFVVTGWKVRGIG